MSRIVNRACFFVALALFVCQFGLSASSDAAARRTAATVRTAQAAGQLKTIQAASSSGTAPCQDAIGDEPDHDGDNCDYVVPNQVDTGDTNAGDNGNQSCPGGCTTWNYSPMTVSLTLHDAPISYRPPVGPAIMFHVSYSQRDVASAGSFFTTNLGPQWTN